MNEREVLQGKVVNCEPPDMLSASAQVTKLASGFLYSWSLLRNNNTAVNLQMFNSSCGNSVLPHVTRARTEDFFHPDLFFSRPVCLGLIMKNRVKSVFSEVINSSATSMCSVI